VTYANALMAKRRYADAAPVLRAAQTTLASHRVDQPQVFRHAVAAAAALKSGMGR